MTNDADNAKHNRPKHPSSRRLAAHQRQQQALELRKAGATYDQIATTLHFASRSGAWHAINAALRAERSDAVEQLRTLMAERLDTALLAIWPRVQQGDDAAIGLMIRIEARRAKLFGLDAPVTFSGDVLLRKLSERAAVDEGLDPQAVMAEAEKILRELTDG